ncbi:MAG: integrase core domain-containing protein [Planctomycetota bacterium]
MYPENHKLLPSWWIALLACILANCLQQRMALQIEYQRREIAILRKRVNGRIRFTDGERRSLASIARKLGRTGIAQIGSLVTPDTLMRWYRTLCAAKWIHPQKRPGRPRTHDEIRQQVLHVAKTWHRAGYTRIHDVMRGLGYRLSRSTVVNILTEAGIPSAPHRGMSWRQFLSAVMDGLFACDMFTVDTPTNTYYCLFVIHIASREVRIAGITANPDGDWMAQQGRNLTDCDNGFLRNCTHLIHDREPTFRHCLDPVLRSSGITPVVTPPRSPNLNAHAERFVRSVRDDCLDRIPILGERHLRHVLRHYVDWYNHERPHQGLDGAYIDKHEPHAELGRVLTRARLGGLLPHFYRAVA